MNLIRNKVTDTTSHQGVLQFDNRRAIVLQQKGFLNLRSTIIQQLGEELANSIFFRFGYKNAQEDYKASDKQKNFTNEIDMLLLGPKLHTGMGYTNVEAEFLHFDRDKKEFLFKGKWHRSFEAEAHLEEYGLSLKPVCYSLCGYGSGWCSSFFGTPVLEIETKCMAQGHPHCEWEIRATHEWKGNAKPWIKASSYGTQSMHEKLTQSKTELLKLNMELAQKIETRTRKLQTLMRLLCHDLKEPLARLSSKLDPNAEARESLLEIYSLIDSVQENNQFETLTRAMHIESIEAQKLIFKLKDSFFKHLIPKNLTITIKFEDYTAVRILADEKILIAHVLPNILSNAIKHSPFGGEITLTARKVLDCLELSISDQGYGIPPAKLRELCIHLENPTDDSLFLTQKSCGVGLKLTAALLHAMNCKIRIDSTDFSQNLLNHGTTTTLAFPIVH